MVANTEQIRFGFLFEKHEVTFSHGSIAPLPDFERLAKIVWKASNKDGYLYPPVESERIIGPGKLVPRTVPRTKRPAHLFILPASHRLEVSTAHKEKAVREESAAFIVHLLGFLFETRLQFEGWRVDGRIPIRREELLASYPGIVGAKLSHAYKVWTGWKVQERMRFLNILFMFSRSENYEWDWETFLFQYSVLDACWKMGSVLFKFKADTHGKRVSELFGHVGVSGQLLDETKDFARLRNDLIHEATWMGGRPGHVNCRLAGPGFSVGIRLAWLNRHVIGSFLELSD